VITLGLKADGCANSPRGVSRRLSAIAAALLAIATIGIVTPSLAVAATGSWTVVSSPNVGQERNELQGVACATARECWAVGLSLNSGGVTKTLVEHYKRGSWQVVASPNEGTTGNELTGIACTDKKNCWAVGNTESPAAPIIEHYDGKTWRLASTNLGEGTFRLNAVTCLSASDCWAVGVNFSGSAEGVSRKPTLVEHYDGTSWSVASGANDGPAGAGLTAVTCTSTSDCWAVGAKGSLCPEGGFLYDCFLTLIEHYDGGGWSIVESPFGSPHGGHIDYVLTSVGCAASGCVAVGTEHSTGPVVDYPLILQYDGSGWMQRQPPRQGADESRTLNGVSCSITRVCVAVGEAQAKGASKTLVEQSVGGGAWTMAESPNVATNGEKVENVLKAVTCGTRACFAVGFSKIEGGGPSTLIEKGSIPRR
jgi:hypothetical protein